MTGEPLAIRLASQANHLGPSISGQLNRDRSDPTRGAGNNHRITRAQTNAPHGCVSRGPCDEQGAGLLPRYVFRTRHQVAGFDQHELGLAYSVVSESNHLIAHRDIRHARSGLLHDAAKSLPWPERERGRPAARQTILSGSPPRPD
jgi:hypothetical protein